VYLAGPVAARLAPALRRLAREARRDGGTLDADLTTVLAALEQAEARWPTPRFRHLSGAGFAPSASTCALPHGGGVASSEVARRVGITEQAVRKAAREGRLAGRLGPDGWRFTEEAIEQFERARRQPA
jgi:hypothetical protein